MTTPTMTEVFKPVRTHVTVETHTGEMKTIDVPKENEIFIKRLERMMFPREAGKGNCHGISRWYLASIGVVDPDIDPWDPELNRYIRRQDDPVHHWVNLDGLNIDWTADQFGPQEEYPKMWED